MSLSILAAPTANTETSEKDCTTPVFSLSPRRKTSTKNELDPEIAKKLEAGEDLYPNCDVSIWLRSCTQEVTQPIEGAVTGEIPTWLKGTLLRNGPGNLKVGDMTFEHLFDSSALLHRFAITEGKITYQNRFLQSQTYKRNSAAQRIVVTEFGTKAVPDPCQSIFQRVTAMFTPGESVSDNAMISVYPFGDEFYTFTESPVIHRIDPVTLETMDRVNLSKYISIVNHSSHPHIMTDGTVYNLGMVVTTTGPSYAIVKFPPVQLSKSQEDIYHKEKVSSFEQASIVGKIPARWPFHPAYMHTFGITDRFFVIVEQPMSVSVSGIVKTTIANAPMAAAFRWYKDEQTLIHLMNQDNGQLFQTFVAEAFFYLHIINCYEDEDHVIVDICCYRDPSMLDCMYIEALKLIKVDTVNHTWKTWCEENVFPSEPIFVPHPCSEYEDHGVVLSSLVWGKGLEKKAGLLVLDATTWTELGRAVFTTPSPVPKCLHGWFTDTVW